MNEEAAIKTLLEVKAVLDKHGVEYWIDSGTLLGAVRDGKFIPWDNDIDLGSWESELPKILDACKELKRKNYQVYISNNVTILKEIPLSIGLYAEHGGEAIRKTIFPRNLLAQILQRLYLIFLSAAYLKELVVQNKDFKMANLTRNLVYILSNFPLASKKGAKLVLYIAEKLGCVLCWKIPIKYLKHLSTIKFYNTEVRAPSLPQEYLEYRYGKDWRRPKRDWIFYRDDGAI